MLGAAALGDCGRDVGLFSPAPSIHPEAAGSTASLQAASARGFKAKESPTVRTGIGIEPRGPMRGRQDAVMMSSPRPLATSSRDVTVRLTAIIAARNEAPYIGRCCEHLATQGISFAVIDNGSTDGTRAIVDSFQGRGLICVADHPYHGVYDWDALLKHKEELARDLDSDWFMHLDADEIPESPQRHESLLARIATADAEGYTAVNFDEFVFVPETEDESHEGRDYVLEMHKYYFFQPWPERLIRAWRKTAEIDLASSGGHAAMSSNRRLCPENFVLRHYIALSMEQLVRKYLHNRVYSEAEVAKGWHTWRSQLTGTMIRVPPADELFDTRSDQGWIRSRPHDRHLFLR